MNDLEKIVEKGVDRGIYKYNNNGASLPSGGMLDSVITLILFIFTLFLIFGVT